MKLKLKVIAGLLSAVFVITCLSVNNFLPDAQIYIEAAEEMKYDEFTYIIFNNEIIITGYNGKSSALDIPSEIDNYNVTSIDLGAFKGNINIESVNIPEGVKEIRHQAFNSCKNLSSVSLPESLTCINKGAFSDTVLLNNQQGIKYVDNWLVECDKDIVKAEINEYTIGIAEGAFSNCTELTSITIPDNVMYLNGGAFYECSKLKNIKLSKNITSLAMPSGSGLFERCTSLESIILPENITSIGIRIFNECENLKSVILPDAITEIPNYAFYNCCKLEEINIPKSVKSIGLYSFENCTNLKSIKLPEKLTVIGFQAFNNCTSLESVNIPDSVTSIEGAAFNLCRNLVDVSLSKSLTEISSGCFSNCTSIQEFIIPGNVVEIANGAFSGCKSLKSIKLPSSLNKIGKRVFSGCEVLEVINIPEKINVIEDGMFDGCKAIKSIELPNSLTEISERAFADCISLESIDIPEKVTYIAANSFINCMALTFVNMPGVKKVDTYAFENCSKLSNVLLNSEASLAENSFSNCPSFKFINNNEVVLVNSESGAPYFDESINDFILNNFNAANNVGFINTYIKLETKYIVSQITTDSMTDIEKAKVLHDWVCNKVTYDYEDVYALKNHVDASIFLNDSTVCDGYASGYSLLLQAAGIESYYISGKTNSGEYHAWNIVNLNDRYFHVDCCWDDSIGNSEYFVLSDKQMLESRNNWIVWKPSSLFNYSEDVTLPLCEYSIGDINTDSLIDIKDVELIQKGLVKNAEISNNDIILADTNKDGNINVLDLILLKRTIIK